MRRTDAAVGAQKPCETVPSSSLHIAVFSRAYGCSVTEVCRRKVEEGERGIGFFGYETWT